MTDGGYLLGSTFPPVHKGYSDGSLDNEAAASHEDAEQCPLALKLSKKSWTVAVSTPLSDKISRYTFKPCDWKELFKLR